MRQLILSTCGTSLLTNSLKNNANNEQLRGLLNRYANARKPEDIPENERTLLQEVIDQALTILLEADTEASKSLSAELSGLFALDNGKLDPQSQHWLIASDTWLGEETARLIEGKIKDLGAEASVMRIAQLRTDSLSDFQEGASKLARLCHEEIKGMRDGGWRVVFNLTGGFKGVQGFMQALGIIYADECVYTFERTNQLIRLPRLPLTLDATGIVRQHLAAFRRMHAGLPTTADDVVGMPPALIYEQEGEYCLSTWGQVIWNEGQQKIYEEGIHRPFDDKLAFAEGFLASTQTTSAKEKRQINQRIDDLTKHLYDKSYNPGSLDFKPLRGKHAPWSHECDAWADGNAKRLFGHFNGNTFILDALAMPLH